MSNMNIRSRWAHSLPQRLDQRGAINVLLFPLIILLLFFVGAVGFGFWAFAGRQDYKERSDQKVAVAVQKAQSETQAADAKQYAEEAKKPNDTYIGPAAFGNVNLKYPKTWSAYVIEKPTGSTPVDGYFQPGYVPDVDGRESAFALRIQVTQQSYSTILKQFSGKVTSKQISVVPYSLPKVPSVVGSRLEGQITETKQGTMVVLPLRNMTLKIWTESNTFKPDLENTILANVTFQP